LFGINREMNALRFLLHRNLKTEKGIPYSDRQLKRLEAKGLFPKRVPLAGGSIKGWPESVIDQHIEKLVEMCQR
jgi:predicted DNA-binding transcriptional regulator AlpA